MMRKHFFSLLVLLLFAAFSVPAMAQNEGAARGNLGGIVLDTTNAVVPGAQVTITGPVGSWSQKTAESGTFFFSTLIPGSYAVKVEKQGFKVAEVPSVEVLINKTSSVRVILEPGEVTQSVVVTGSAMTVDTSSAAVNANLADTFYKSIPIQRGVASLFYLSPGVVSGLRTGNSNPSISGGSGLENLYVADGVSITQSGYGGLGVWTTAYGALGSGINLSFVKEVQVKTAGFEPQYGRSTGGVIQIVTKSGSDKFHGALAGYFNTTAMQTPFANADDPQFNVSNLVGRHLNDARYEADAELGGYVPLGSLRNHLFFFGTFNPSWLYEHWAPALGSGLFGIYNGNAERRTLTKDYAAKLTFKINDSNTLESSVFGDPNSTNAAPFRTLNSDNASANSQWNYGTRNFVARYNGTITPTWQLNGAFTYNWNHFTETPALDIYGITDDTQLGAGQRGAFNAQGIGFVENYEATSKSFNIDTSKIYSFGGQHTFQIGYLYDNPTYNDITTRSGPRFVIPTTNASGQPYLTASQAADIPAGSTTNATFALLLAPSSCTLCPLDAIPQADGSTVDERVLLRQTRGTFSSGISHNTGVYHTAYINDSWAMGRHATLNLGLRWEQQRVNGVLAGANFHNMWEPRISFIVDPKGDRKTKLYASFARLAFVLPLDIAIRSLSSEADYLNARFAPVSDSTGHVVLNQFNTVEVQPDAAHLLNKADGGVTNNVSVSAQSGGEPFVPSTKMEYNDEFVVGAEHEFRGGVFVSVRYIDRRLKRIIEDFSGISVEAGLAGLSQTYVIGNPSGSTDFVVNPNEITFGLGTTLPANTPLPAACVDKNGNATPFSLLNVTNTFGQVQGSVCFPSVNLNPWTDSSGNLLPNALFGGEVGSDGQPDGFVNPSRIYQAVEIEVNKAFSHNWAIYANWRIARLMGNYEGAFRNDNGQADPGISSLFDLTPGKLGLLGTQQDPGILNTDRKHVINVYTTYVLDRSFAKGLELGSGLRIQSGVPLTTLAAQEYYVNSGEVPLFGRGDLGRTPVTGTVDAHIMYPWKISERMTLKFGFDAFNIGNTKRETLENQNVDLQFGVTPNLNFMKPVGTFFVAPFESRGTIRLEF
jgi:Carboxypeptidase regulatory-like domain